MLTEKNLRKLGFTTVGDELGDDGALQKTIGNDEDDLAVLIWVPDIKGNYIDDEVTKGMHLVLEYTTWLQLPHIKTPKQVQELYYILSNEKLKELKGKRLLEQLHKITTLE